VVFHCTLLSYKVTKWFLNKKGEITIF